MQEVSYKSPLYIQLREVIRGKIEDGEYAPGTAIPSENQLAETYGLNRLSVRSALAALEYEGLLKSVQGKGVFVVGPKPQRDLETLGGYRNTMHQQERHPSTKMLIKAQRKAGPYYSLLLQIDPEDDIWYIRRINRAGGEVVGLEEIYIPVSILPNLDAVDINVFSIYDAYEWAGIRPLKGYQLLRITPVNAACAKLLDLDGPQDIMEFSCITHDENGRPIEFARNRARNDRSDFVVHYQNQRQ